MEEYLAPADFISRRHLPWKEIVTVAIVVLTTIANELNKK